MSDSAFSAAPVMADLMDFQRRTVNYAFRRLFTAADSTDRFLVADEVGLGKTMVARGIAARTIEYLQKRGTERIDIVYVCSNGAIARQNVARLRMEGVPDPVNVDRLTLLPMYINQIGSRGVSTVAFTPGTSFQLKQSLGRITERALLLLLLQHPGGWGRAAAGKRARYIMRGDAGLDSFDAEVRRCRALLGSPADNQPAICFWERLAERADLREEWDWLLSAYCRRDSRPPKGTYGKRSAFVGELRQLLAAASLDALQPDLIILDEFQRFTHLLDGTGDDAELAKELFDWRSSERDERARVLMLSATPYKMYTLDSESECDNHYRDLLRTLKFLVRDSSRRVRTLDAALTAFGYAVDLSAREGAAGIPALKQARTTVEHELGRVMSRTERLAATADHGGMLAELSVPEGMGLTEADVRGYVGLHAVGVVAGHANPTEYWKSIPYPLTYLHGYRFRADLDRTLGSGMDAGLDSAVEDAGLLLSAPAVGEFGKVGMANPRLRVLAAQAADALAARALWVPPSMPYYELSSPFVELRDRDFTKRLVFSAWVAVPRAAASLLTYESERQAYRGAYGNRRLDYAEPTKGSPIRFKKSRRAGLSGLGTWGWLYPSSVLAEMADPLRLCRSAGEPLPSEQMLHAAEVAIAPRLARVVKRSGVETFDPAQADPNWYWLAPMLLDATVDSRLTDEFLDGGSLISAMKENAAVMRREIGDELLDEVLEVARAGVADPSSLGPAPADLARVVAYLALASPATCALRALARGQRTGRPMRELELRRLAYVVGAALRDMFNRPHSIAAVRCSKPRGVLRGKPWWLQAIGYAFDGGIQPMLDEYAHVLASTEPDLVGVAREMVKALSVGATQIEAQNPPPFESRGIRTHHAAAFGLGRASDEQQAVRSMNLRDAFNSPFRPFALISTSVGQEGLDFHRYCHAIVHWNLPCSPVDFEQREGRVHRYKGHAVRKNVATRHRESIGAAGDPWTSAFRAAARESKRIGASEMVPYWVYPGPAQIIREVPELPHSSDALRRRQLQRTLGAYRMVFGQPRQEDLVEYLLEELRDPGELARLQSAAAVDLRPKR